MNSILCKKNSFFFPPDQRPSVAPLFEAQLDLKVPDLVFTPPLDIRVGDSFFDLVETLVNDVFRISSLVPRVARHGTVSHYQVILPSFFLISVSKNATRPISVPLRPTWRTWQTLLTCASSSWGV